jgi:hypothetical protein
LLVLLLFHFKLIAQLIVINIFRRVYIEGWGFSCLIVNGLRVRQASAFVCLIVDWPRYFVYGRTYRPCTEFRASVEARTDAKNLPFMRPYGVFWALPSDTSEVHTQTFRAEVITQLFCSDNDIP